MVGVVAGKSSENVNAIDILKKVYPVGAIYMSLTDTNPSLLFGGAWEQIEDVFLYAGKVGDANYAPGKTGGEKTHTLTVTEMPIHNHSQRYDDFPIVDNRDANTNTSKTERTPVFKINDTTSKGKGTANTGGGKAHNNMPPFLAVYMWKRVE